MRRWWCLLGLATVVHAAVPTAVCPGTTGEIKVDGSLNEAAWQAAPALPEFMALGPRGGSVGDRVVVKVVSGKRALFLGATVKLPGGRQPDAPERERDGKVWNDDEIELFLRTDPTSDSYDHLMVNAAGSLADARHDPHWLPAQQAAWGGKWVWATKHQPGQWTLELELPYAELGVTPRPGHVWGLKVTCQTHGAENVAWPRNLTQSFHDANAWGLLLFQRENLLENPSFEAPVDDRGRAPNWGFSYHETEGKGKIEVAPGGRPPGLHCAHYEKFDDYLWFPQLWTNAYAAQPGSTYHVKAWVKCDKQFVLRHTFFAGEKGVAKHSQPAGPSPEWGPFEWEFTLPPEADRVALGFQLSRQSGHLYVDEVSLVRVNDTFAPAPTLAEPDDIHNLLELATRRRFKPWAALKQDAFDQPPGWYEPDRVIFHDSATGATIRKLTRSGGSSTRHTYMEMSPWNADGSLLLLTTGQMGKGTYVLPADGSRMRYLPYYASSWQWDRQDPTLLYYRAMEGDQWAVYRRHLDDPEPELLKTFQGEPSIWPMHPDGQWLLVRESFSQPPASTIWLMNRDGQRWIDLHPPHQVHQTWFTKLPDHSVEFEYEGQEPRGQYRIFPDGKLVKICDETFGHRAHSPDGKWVAGIGRARLIPIDGGEQKLLADVGTNHQTWRASLDWFAGSSGRHLVRVSTTDRFGFQRLGSHNSSLLHSTYWSEAHPEMSADGTKLAYASNMLHDIEYYELVMGLPQAPPTLTAKATDGKVTLSWPRPQRSAELRGYLVYRSKVSGERGAQLTPEPIAATSYQDTPGNGNWCYCVTAVEHSGLESLASPEAVVGNLPRCYLSEAEAGLFEAPAEEVFDPTAAGLYAVRLGTIRSAEGLTVPLTVEAGKYGLWLRAKGPVDVEGRPQAWQATLQVEGQAAGAPESGEPGWLWLQGEPVELEAGEVTVEVRSSRPSAVIDQVALLPVGRRPPAGSLGVDVTAPAAPPAPSAKPHDAHAIRLTWPPAEAADLEHYNVYVAVGEQVTPTRDRLVGSPSGPTFLDWGLRSGTGYSYCVTAVDRAGNESNASPVVQVATPALPVPLHTVADVTLDQEHPSATLDLTASGPTRCVVWVHSRSTSGKREAHRYRVVLDGTKVADARMSIDYVCVGHGGPLLTSWLWSVATLPRETPAAPVGFEVAPGPHQLTVELADGAPMVLDRIVVTNDLGYLPPGRCDFLVDPIRPGTAEP